MKLDYLITTGDLLAVYPLHNPKKIEALTKEIFNCGNIFPWNQPLYHLRDYFGEKIAVYFGFIGTFSLSLAIPSLTGLGTEVVIAYFVNIDHPIAAFYSIFIVLWSVFFLEQWKRRFVIH